MASSRSLGGLGRFLLLGAVVLGALTVLFAFRDRGEEMTATAPTPEEAKEIQKLRKRLDSLKPKGLYILVDTGSNRLYLRRGDEVLLDAACSTGSGRQLVAPNGSWSFETPRGEFSLHNKVRDPVWRKPDWAFLEEGQPVPKDDRERYEGGVLGEYAMGIGNGYFIHGTLYTRLLGRNVTHGCIRLASKDLVYLAKTAPVGTKVYVY